MKIALLGPSAPYRGGIAHHNNMLVRSLRERGHRVDMITFSRQYPAFLYPGAFQLERGEEFADIGAERLLDSMNPVSWFRTAAEIRRREYDLVINRFWIPLFAPMFGTVARRLGGGRPDGRVVTVVDNLLPHEPRPGDRAMTRFQFRYCNGAITQSGTVSRQFQQSFPSIPETLIPHPVYEHFGRPMPREEARRRLGIGEGPCLLFFGFVRRYKGLDLLLEAMPAILERVPEARLLVVGEYFDDQSEYEQIIDRHRLADRVDVVDRYIPNEEVPQWFSAADLLVLPYRSATNSGIVQIGYNFSLPSIVTDVGSLSEVVIDGHSGIVIPDTAPETIAEAVVRGLQPDMLQAMREGIVEERKKYSWSEFARRLEAFALDRVLSGS